MDDTKIDRRRHYILVFDTETANTHDTIYYTVTNPDGTKETRSKKGVDMSDVLMYDCGWCVMDTRGNVYLERSYVNRDIFCYERDLMRAAYYANKIPQYVEDLRNGVRIMADTCEIRKQMLDDIQKYNIKEVCAHNARFDVNALNVIQRWTTKSKFRYWLPCGIEIWDSMRMASDVIGNMPTYRKFCEEHELLTSTGKLSMTAESLYKYITKNPDFVESHTGLEDVRIEREIVKYCYRQKKKMRKHAFNK